jgi:uncharacterized protein YbjT (DUF2867 family)
MLVLGSTGFVGRGVTHKLLDAGYQVRVLVRDQMKAAAYRVRGADVMVGDVLDPQAVTRTESSTWSPSAGTGRSRTSP